MNRKGLVQRRESERRVKGEGNISAWKTEAFKCQVNAIQTPLIAIICFAHHFAMFAFIFTRVEQLVKKVEELQESLQQIDTNHLRDQQ